MTQLVLSNSQTLMWQHSPRCSWWRYIRDLELAGSGMPDAPRTWGDAVHKGFESLYQGASVEESVQNAVENSSISILEEFGDFHTPSALRTLLDEYALSVLPEDLERFEVLHTEQDMQGDLSTTLAWMGKIDLTLREKNTGEVFIFDHKTTGKKVDSSYWTDQFSHDQQMTSYWWLASHLYGDDFAGLLINACQTTKTIPFNFSRTVITRDQWQIDEWYSNISALGPAIRSAYESGRQFLAAGLEAHHPEVLATFPICNTYSENFCDYRFINQTPPELREALISQDYTTRSARGGDVEED